MKKTSLSVKSVCCFIISAIIFLNTILMVTATSEKTYSYLSDDGVMITFIPTEGKVQIKYSSDWRNSYIGNWVIGATYLNNTMTACSIKSICSGDDIILDVVCLPRYPLVCKVFVIDENCVPQTLAINCNLYSQAYCVEDGTFDYIVKYNQLQREHNDCLNKLQNDMLVLEEYSNLSQDKITQARLDLANLPTEKNSYISKRAAYHRANGASSSTRAQELATRDWENYYTSQTAKLNSIIITEEDNIVKYLSQIEEKREEIESSINGYKADVTKLKEDYPYAGNGMSGGTYETDNYTFEELLQQISETYDFKLARLQEDLYKIEELCGEAEQKLTQARLDLANLPTEKNSYISARAAYHRANGAGSSTHAQELATRDWENYYTSQTARLNSEIIIEEENISGFIKQIGDKENDIEQCNKQYEENVASLKKRFGVE